MQLQRKTKIFLTEPHPDNRRLLLLKFFFNEPITGGNLYGVKLPPDFAYTTFEFVSKPEEADFFLAPADVRVRDTVTEAYLTQLKDLSRLHKKKVVIFIGGDLAYTMRIPEEEFLVCIGSQYKSALLPNEIIVPPFTEDIWYEIPPEKRLFRNKDAKPTVGFCGWAGYATLRTSVVSRLRNLKFSLLEKMFPGRTYGARIKGVAFRVKAMEILSESEKVKTNFTIRNSYSGNVKTIGLSPKKARAEYIDSILNSDLTLAPKGDGNYSIRFYEVLSLGRLPLFIDTDSELPFEKLGIYGKIVFRLSYKQIDAVADFVASHYEEISQGEYVAIQDQARTVYRDYLRYDSFFNRLFGEVIFEYVKTSDVPHKAIQVEQ